MKTKSQKNKIENSDPKIEVKVEKEKGSLTSLVGGLIRNCESF